MVKRNNTHTTNYCSIWYTLKYICAKEAVDIFSQAFSGKSTVTFLFIWLLDWQNWDWLFGAVAKFPETGISLMLWQVKGSCPLLCRNWVTQFQATMTSVVVSFDLNLLCYESFWYVMCILETTSRFVNKITVSGYRFHCDFIPMVQLTTGHHFFR